MLKLCGVSKRYGDFVALHPTDLTCEAGKTTALLGPSGCGKSTLLRTIVGLVPPSSGAIHFDGVEITRDNLRQVRHRIGYMTQDGGLFPHLSIRDNVTLLARHLRWAKSRLEDRLEQLTALTHLPPASLARFPSQVSGGQRQRASLMRALFLDPEALLLDEPMGALDPLIRSELQQELRAVFQTLGKSVVLVTHDIGEAGYLAEALVLFRAGRIVQQGSLADLVHRPADPFVRQFINAQRSPLDSLDEGQT